MNTKILPIYLNLLLTLILYAEIPMIHPFKNICNSLNMRLFIETNQKGRSDANLSAVIVRLHFLSTLVQDGNSPPNIGEALGAALPASTISPLDNNSFRISDHELNQNQKNLLHAKVEVNEFTGNISDLLKTTFPLGNIILCSGGAIGEDLGKITELDIHIEKFTFSGTFQSFLEVLATHYGEACGYKAKFTSDKTIELYFWGHSKNI